MPLTRFPVAAGDDAANAAYGAVAMPFSIPTWAEVSQVRQRYHQHYGRYPSLLFPRTYSELMQRRKLFDRKPIYTLFCDKLASRDFVAAQIGERYLPPMQWSGADPDRIPFEALRYPVIIKPRHLSGFVKIVRALPDQDERTALRDHFHTQMLRNHGRQLTEPGYYNVPPGVLVEDLLTEPGGTVPIDYKFLVFHGRAVMIQAHFGRYTQHEVGFFDLDWKRLPYTRVHPAPSGNPAPPPNLAEMIGIAERLARGQSFLRVDLYDSGRVYFGEFTVYPGSGFDPFEPRDLDRRLGEIWRRCKGASLW